jgi:hypothetical protein
MATAEDWQNELRRWLGPFLSHLGHKARRRMCPLYVAASWAQFPARQGHRALGPLSC